MQFIAFSFLKRMLAADREFYTTLGQVMDDQILKLTYGIHNRTQIQVPNFQSKDNNSTQGSTNSATPVSNEA